MSMYAIYINNIFIKLVKKTNIKLCHFILTFLYLLDKNIVEIIYHYKLFYI